MSEPIAIRTIAAGDLDQLLALYVHLNPDDSPPPENGISATTWRTIQASPHIRHLGAYAGTALLACCHIVLIPNLTRGCRPYGVIENVVTHRDHRGQGLATRLLHAALDHAWAHGAYKVVLTTSRRDEATLRFYQRAGFDRFEKQAFIARAPH
ncbi:GNAT family N-acetyltransferase [Phytohalomonas tamaricis]|uniref:GNAT family N-acetyltransferase n=1 Tax=Phytohalomonas tamaricis TaxID=2081032 RepID=UPI000D0B7900|nr:GNAT family N-acetyltransferase [Phytohalomonas tamaricis]